MNTELLFTKYQNMIRKSAHKYHTMWGVDYEDLEAQGYLIFCEAIERFDATRAGFGTFLTNRLKTLNDYCISLKCRKSAPTAYEHIEKVPGTITYIAPTFSNPLAQLAEDAQTVATHLLSREWEVIGSAKKPSLSSTTNHFVAHGWTPARVRSAWTDLSQWWQAEGSFSF